MINGLSMTYIDVAVILTLLISAIFAYNRGIVKEIMTIASWIIAVMVAMHFYHLGLPFTQKYIANETIATGVTIAVLFVITLVICSILVSVFCSFEVTSLVALNKTLGFVFGLLRGALITSLFFLAISLVWQEKALPPIIKNSKTLPLMQTGSQLLIGLIPLPLQNKIPSSVISTINLNNVTNVNTIYNHLLVPKINTSPTNNTLPNNTLPNNTLAQQADHNALNDLIATNTSNNNASPLPTNNPAPQNNAASHTALPHVQSRPQREHKTHKNQKHKTQNTKHEQPTLSFPKGHLINTPENKRQDSPKKQNKAPQTITAKDQEELDLFINENNH